MKLRKYASRPWVVQALPAAYELLAGDDRLRDSVLRRCGVADLSGEEGCTAACRRLVLDALYMQWRRHGPQPEGAGSPGPAVGTDAGGESRGELVLHVPEPSLRDRRGLYGAEAIFRFAERAEALIDYSVAPPAGGRGARAIIKAAQHRRKTRGMYFTPYQVAAFMVDQCLSPILEALDGPIGQLFHLRVLDPAIGTGRFLIAAAERIAGQAAADTAEAELDVRRRVIESCLYGIDRSAFAVAAARCALGLYAGLELVPDMPNLKVGDSLIDREAARDFAWEGGGLESFFTNGGEGAAGGAAFDAIVGNPPYVANKNEPAAFYSPYLGKAGQSDRYLLFVHKYAVKKLLKPGGAVSFVVPDPVLCRGNAEGARLRLLEELDLVRLVHARTIFPEAGVANVIFLARRPPDDAFSSTEGAAPARQRPKASTVRVVRLETAEACRRFFRGPDSPEGFGEREVSIDAFRGAPAKELRYLLTNGAEKVVGRLDTRKPPPRNCGVVIRSLGSLAGARGAIFRGEEIGKAAVRAFAAESRKAGFPALLGGESIARYTIRDEGLVIPVEAVRKDIGRYRRQKILIPKSTGRLVAALDSKGFVFPQSVYGILVNDPRIGYGFMLAQLNSHLVNFYVHVMFTGYKLVQPQVEIEDIKRLPVIVPEFEESVEVRRPSLETAKGLFKQFLETDDPGWMIEYLEESLKLPARKGSALIHDLLEFLGMRMIESDPRAAAGERQRLEWLIDLLMYRICGLEVDEVELVESFFQGEARSCGGDAEPALLVSEDPVHRDRALWKKEEPRLYGGDG